MPNFRVIRVMHSLNYVRLLYETFLDKRFDSANEIYFISFYSYNFKNIERPYNVQPVYSRNFGKFSSRYSSETELQANVFYVSNEWIKIHLQPYPYDTDCSHGNGRFYCMRYCIKQKLLKINRVPFTEITRECELPFIGHLYPVRPIDITNNTIQDFVYDSETSCEKECRQRPCQLFFTRTVLSCFLDKRFNYSTRIKANCHDKPVTEIITVVNFDLFQLIIYVSSCFGIWFGISIISLDPTKTKFFARKLKVRESKRTPVERLVQRKIIN